MIKCGESLNEVGGLEWRDGENAASGTLWSGEGLETGGLGGLGTTAHWGWAAGRLDGLQLSPVPSTVAENLHRE